MKPFSYKSLGDKMRMIRKQNRMTQQNMAYLFGIDRSSYSYYEGGSIHPSVAFIYMFCKLFSVSAEWLMEPDTDDETVS